MLEKRELQRADGHGSPRSTCTVTCPAGPALLLRRRHQPVFRDCLSHGLVIFGVGRLLKFDAGTLPVASQANIGGAASAVAIASARGYADKLLPGIAVALAGYAVGNYFGFGMGVLARTLLGG